MLVFGWLTQYSVIARIIVSATEVEEYPLVPIPVAGKAIDLYPALLNFSKAVMIITNSPCDPP